MIDFTQDGKSSLKLPQLYFAGREKMTLQDSLDQCADKLVNARRVVIFTGAGMSADSGINTFRGSSSGFWSGCTGGMALAYFGTPYGWKMTPEFAMRQYLRNFYKPIMKAKPNAGHVALAALEKELIENGECDAFDIVTMNVDGYHQRAGTSAEKVHEVHGTITSNRCTKCSRKMDIEEELERFMQTGKYKTQKCSQDGCVGIARPDVVLFTEGLPGDVWNEAERAVTWMRNGDVMLVIGTSDKVYPAAGLPEMAERNGAHVIHFDISEKQREGEVIGKAGETLPKLLEMVQARLAHK